MTTWTWYTDGVLSCRTYAEHYDGADFGVAAQGTCPGGYPGPVCSPWLTSGGPTIYDGDPSNHIIEAEANTEEMEYNPISNYFYCTTIGSNFSSRYIPKMDCSECNDPCDESWCESMGGVCYEGNCSWATPIVIPTGHSQAVQLTSPAGGVVFDVDGSGTQERVAWTQEDAEVAFLAIDRDGDGRITSGRELLGNFTVPDASNGFAALAVLFGQRAAESLGPENPLFTRLLLWTDRNHDGVSEPDELQLASTLIQRIGLWPTAENRRDGMGNLYRFRSWAEFSGTSEFGGRTAWIYDVVLKVAQK